MKQIRPSKFRTAAKNYKEQIYYFNYNKKDRTFHWFLAVRNKHQQVK